MVPIPKHKPKHIGKLKKTTAKAYWKAKEAEQVEADAKARIAAMVKYPHMFKARKPRVMLKRNDIQAPRAKKSASKLAITPCGAYTKQSTSQSK